ncbi:MAG TPA: thioredoxin family protein [Acidimicrobiia bacterium]|nr:thioredoxin family protein [Acidimicrobiia bacterium]
MSQTDRIPITMAPTVIEIRTPQCHACAAMEPHLRAVAEQHAGTVDFIQVDASVDPGTAADLGVRGTPTLVGFRDGVEVARTVGRLSSSELDALFTSIADGTDLPRLGMREAAFRLVAGLCVVTVGVFAGPAWPLVAIGAIVTGWGGLTWLRTR